MGAVDLIVEQLAKGGLSWGIRVRLRLAVERSPYLDDAKIPCNYLRFPATFAPLALVFVNSHREAGVFRAPVFPKRRHEFVDKVAG